MKISDLNEVSKNIIISDGNFIDCKIVEVSFSLALDIAKSLGGSYFDETKSLKTNIEENMALEMLIFNRLINQGYDSAKRDEVSDVIMGISITQIEKDNSVAS